MINTNLNPNPYKRKGPENLLFVANAKRHAEIYKYMLENYGSPNWANYAAVTFKRSHTAIHKSIKTVETYRQWFIDQGLIEGGVNNGR